MKRIYTEIRIPHESQEAKERFEILLDMALKTMTRGRNRSEWAYEKCCQLIGEAELEKLGINTKGAAKE